MDPSRIIVVGGHTRNIGKTALVVDIIRAIPEAKWTAIKITQFGHGVCSINGEQCGCAPKEHAFSLSEETDHEGKSDTSRFLVAGADRSLWVRTKQGQLAAAMPALRDALSGSGNIIIESNTLLGLLRPRLYLVVIDPAQEDFKESAQRFLDFADALILRSRQPFPNNWAAHSLVATKPAFHQPLGNPLPQEVVGLVRSGLGL